MILGHKVTSEIIQVRTYVRAPIRHYALFHLTVQLNEIQNPSVTVPFVSFVSWSLKRWCSLRAWLFRVFMDWWRILYLAVTAVLMLCTAALSCSYDTRPFMYLSGTQRVHAHVCASKHTHTQTHKETRTHTRAHAHKHTHAHTQTCTQRTRKFHVLLIWKWVFLKLKAEISN